MKPYKLDRSLNAAYHTFSARMTDLDIIGDILQGMDAGADWCESNKNYVWYYALGHSFGHAKSLAEIGVRFGYSLHSVMKGIRSVSGHELRVFGFDNESYVQGSNAIAMKNLTRFKNAIIDIRTVNSMQDGITVLNNIDIFSIDGDHTYTGTMRDMEMALPMLSYDGILVVDDITGIPESPEIKRACRDFARNNKLAYFLVPTYRGMYIMYRHHIIHQLKGLFDGMFPAKCSV
jgi:hypothetical protein